MRKVFSAFSTLEMLTVLAILAFFVLQSASFLWQGTAFSSQKMLDYEGEKLLLFLRYVRQQANETNHKWGIWLEQNEQDWCVIGWQKEGREETPPCFCQTSCPKKAHIAIYFPRFPKQTYLQSRSPLPLSITTFNGVRGSAKSNHFILRNEKHCLKLTFNNTLSIHSQAQKCKNE